MSHFSFSLSHTLIVFLFIFIVCNLNKEKCLIFFFTLSHSHCVSLYFFTRIAPPQVEALTCVSLIMSEWLSCFSSLFQLSTQGRMAFASFFSFSSTCPTHLLSFASLLIKRGQTFPCMLSFALNQKTDFVGLEKTSS